jgi:hypothetical protein
VNIKYQSDAICSKHFAQRVIYIEIDNSPPLVHAYFFHANQKHIFDIYGIVHQNHIFITMDLRTVFRVSFRFELELILMSSHYWRLDLLNFSVIDGQAQFLPYGKNCQRSNKLLYNTFHFFLTVILFSVRCITRYFKMQRY